MKQTPIRSVSKKRAAGKRLEVKLTQRLLEMTEGICEICNLWPTQKGLVKHEIQFRGRLGDPTDPFNCLLLCSRCHVHARWPKTGTPISTEEQFEIARQREERG